MEEKIIVKVEFKFSTFFKIILILIYLFGYLMYNYYNNGGI